MNRTTSIFLLLALVSCNEKFEFQHPSVFTGEAHMVNDSTAIFHGNIENHSKLEIIESGFVWGPHSKDNNGIKLINIEEKTGVIKLQTNHYLLPNQTYYVRAYAQTEFNTTYGNESSFESKGSEISKGNWFDYYISEEGRFCEFVNTSFSIKNLTYILLGDGSIYEFDHTSKEVKFLTTSEITPYVSYTTTYLGNAYVFSLNGFFKFDPANISFVELSKWPVEDRHACVGFSIGNEFYIGLGISASGYTKEFWRYNLEADLWQQIQDFHGDFRRDAFSYNLNNKGYVGGGSNSIKRPFPKFNDLWLYSPMTNNWIEKESLPFENEIGFGLIGANFEGDGYCFYQYKLYKYNHVFDLWQEMDSLEYSGKYCLPHLFASEDQLFTLSVTGDINERYFNIWHYGK